MKTGKFKDKATGRWKWTADFTVGGKRHRLVADSTTELYDQIDKVRRDARAEALGLPVERAHVTVAELVERRINGLDPDTRGTRWVANVLRDFASRFPVEVRRLSEPDLADYVRAIKAEFKDRQRLRQRRKPEAERAPARDLSPATVNRLLGVVSSMLNDAPNLCRELAGYRAPRFPWAKVSQRKRRRPIRDDEADALLAHLRAPLGRWEQPSTMWARHEIADLFEVNMNTGMRAGEATALSWTQVNFLNGEIYLGRTKNGDDRFVPMNSRVVEIMRRRYEARVNGWVFPNMTGTGRRTDYLHTFRRVAREAGLPYGLFTDYGFTMHSTRHTATTRMLRAGADVATVQEVVGHSDRTMTLVYSHASAETKKRAVEGLVRKDEKVEKEP